MDFRVHARKEGRLALETRFAHRWENQPIACNVQSKGALVALAVEDPATSIGLTFVELDRSGDWLALVVATLIIRPSRNPSVVVMKSI
jgi:hypothetical protein